MVKTIKFALIIASAAFVIYLLFIFFYKQLYSVEEAQRVYQRLEPKLGNYLVSRKSVGDLPITISTYIIKNNGDVIRKDESYTKSHKSGTIELGKVDDGEIESLHSLIIQMDFNDMVTEGAKTCHAGGGLFSRNYTFYTAGSTKVINMCNVKLVDQYEILRRIEDIIKRYDKPL